MSGAAVGGAIEKEVRRLDNGIEAAQVRDVTGDRQPLAAGAPSREVGHHAMAMFPRARPTACPMSPVATLAMVSFMVAV